jgi:hypothetical protein
MHSFFKSPVVSFVKYARAFSALVWSTSAQSCRAKGLCDALLFHCSASIWFRCLAAFILFDRIDDPLTILKNGAPPSPRENIIDARSIARISKSPLPEAGVIVASVTIDARLFTDGVTAVAFRLQAEDPVGFHSSSSLRAIQTKELFCFESLNLLWQLQPASQLHVGVPTRTPTSKNQPTNQPTKRNF